MTHPHPSTEIKSECANCAISMPSAPKSKWSIKQRRGRAYGYGYRDGRTAAVPAHICCFLAGFIIATWLILAITYL